jgi:hypothetical protein
MLTFNLTLKGHYGSETMYDDVCEKTDKTKKPEYYDRFGNNYSRDDIDLFLADPAPTNMNVTECDNNGVFNPIFFGTWNANEQATICQMLSDLSAIIAPSQNASVVNIVFDKDPDPIFTNSSPVFEIENCGIAYSLIQLLLLNQVGLEEENSGLMHGYCAFSENIMWHALADDNTGGTGPVATNAYDLYSVSLHEMIHVLGVHSLITADGTPLQGQYSFWDTHLYSDVAQDFLLQPSANGACCDEYEFNYSAIGAMPAALQGGCSDDVFFREDGVSIVEVSAPISAAIANNVGIMQSRLNHLDFSCSGGTPQHVMHHSFDLGEARRILSQQEEDILCALGYGSGNDCTAESNCITIAANDDGFVYNLSEVTSASIPVAEITGNDVFAPGSTVQLLEGCNSNILDVVWNAGTQSFDLQLNAVGSTTFCYELIGCDGYCDEASVDVTILPESILLSSCANACNLTCYADFEDFDPNTGNDYFAQMGIPTFQLDISDDGNPDIRGNANTIREENGNNVIRIGIANSDQVAGSVGAFQLPLSSPIEPGCVVDINFEAAFRPVLGTVTPGVPTIKFFALTNVPCAVTNYPYDCTNTPFSLACDPLITAACMTAQSFPGNSEGIVLTQAPNVDDLFSHSFTWQNNTGETITNLLVLPGNELATNGLGGLESLVAYRLDNIVVTADCISEVAINGGEHEACINGSTPLQVEVCLDASGTAPQDLELQLDLVNGVTIESGDFDATGSVNTTLTPGTCQQFNVNLSLDATYIPGTVLELPLSVSSETTFCTDEEATNSILLNVADCPGNFSCPCPGSGPINIDAGDGTSLSELILSGALPAQLSNSCVSIAGQLLIDQNYTITGGEMRMQPGAEIVVQSGAVLTLQGIDQNRGIYGCGQMWRGIRVESNGQLFMINCEIEDAQHAVTGEPNSLFILDGNYFNRNYIGIFTPYSGFQAQNVFASVVNNDFRSENGALLPPFDNNLWPAPTDVAYAGVVINDVFWFEVGANNTFERVQQGVRGINVWVLNVRNSTFTDIQGLSPGQFDNTAVYSSLSFADVDDCEFTNCESGIVSELPRYLRVTRNVMTGVGRGVASFNTGISRVQVNGENNLDCETTAVYVHGYTSPGDVDIEDNVIRASLGVLLEGSSLSGYPGDLDVRENLISINSGTDPGEGVRVNGVAHCEVENNTVTANATNHLGISINNGHSIEVAENTVTGVAGNVAFGIVCNATPNVDVRCNNVSGFAADLSFQNDCSCNNGGCTQVRGNTMTFANGSFERGLTVVNNGIISEQIRTGNQWVGFVGTQRVGARYTGFQPLLFGSRFVVQTGNAPYHPQTIAVGYTGGGIGNPSDWFDIEAGPFYDAACVADVGQIQEDIDIYHELARNQTFPGDWGSDWIAKRHLYGRLQQSPSLLHDPILQSFVDTNQHQPLGLFYEVDQMLGEATSLSLGQDSTLQLYEDEMIQAADLMRGLTEQAYLGGQFDHVQATAAADDFEQAKTAYDSLWNIHGDSAQVKIDLASQELGTTNFHYLPADNLAAVYRIWLQQLQADTLDFTAAQLTTLQAIAAQCPEKGGDGVFVARALISETGTHWPNCSSGGTQALLQEGKNALAPAVREETVRVYPNPASSVLNIELPALEDGHIELLSLSGRVLWQQPVRNGGIHTVDIQAWPAGLYFYNIRTPEGMLKQGKFVKE